MRNPGHLARLILAAGLSAGALALAAGPAGAQEPWVAHLSLDGVVDPFVANYIRDGIARAQDDGAAAVLLTIDTPGGLDSSMREIVGSILHADVPVICYVAPPGARAASAGTFVLESCPVAAMAPATEVGAAHPVGVAGAIEQQKVTNDAVAYIQALAKLRGRNVDWVEQAVRDSVSVPADTALELNVIDLVAPSTEALLADVEGTQVAVGGGKIVTINIAGATIRETRMGLGARILHSLLTPDLAFIFFYLGLGLIVIEVLHPGATIPGILGVLSLVAAFASFGVLPVQLLGVTLLLASAVFFLLELKHPGLGAFTLGGVVTLVLGGLTLFNPSVPNARVSPWVIGAMALALVGFFGTVVTAAIAARRMPRTTPSERLLGAKGVVTVPLDPEGVVRVGGEEWTALSETGAVPRDANVRVLAVEGLRLKVQRIDESAPAEPGPGGR
ncbi:MAG: nodulation protein NfeD [Actinobacteria bacterium]|nr:nodulation protein NfeD [Actinomycetota bacterium]